MPIAPSARPKRLARSCRSAALAPDPGGDIELSHASRTIRFRKDFSLGRFHARLARLRDSDYDPSSWWETRPGLKLFFTESVGYCYAMWELRQPQPAVQPPASIVVPRLWDGLLGDRNTG